MRSMLKQIGIISSNMTNVNSTNKVYFNLKGAFWQFAVHTKKWGIISLRVPSSSNIMGGKWSDWVLMFSANATMHTASYIATNSDPVKEIVICAERRKKILWA